MFQATAELEYHNTWLIAKCSQDTLEYYRWWIWRKTHIWVMKPKWGAHISIVRGSEEREPVTELYRLQRENLNIQFYYNNKLEQHYNYIWMPVWGSDLNNVREECGLPREPIMPFHMTVGMNPLLEGREWI